MDRERAETDPQRVGRRQRDDGRRQRREAQTPDAALSSSARLVELLNAYGAKGGVHPAPRWPANQEMHAQYELTRAKGVYDLADAQVQRATEATMLISAWSRSGVLWRAATPTTSHGVWACTSKTCSTASRRAS